jgi:hypothetical protein
VRGAAGARLGGGGARRHGAARRRARGAFQAISRASGGPAGGRPPARRAGRPRGGIHAAARSPTDLFPCCRAAPAPATRTWGPPRCGEVPAVPATPARRDLGPQMRAGGKGPGAAPKCAGSEDRTSLVGPTARAGSRGRRGGGRRRGGRRARRAGARWAGVRLVPGARWGARANSRRGEAAGPTLPIPLVATQPAAGAAGVGAVRRRPKGHAAPGALYVRAAARAHTALPHISHRHVRRGPVEAVL